MKRSNSSGWVLKGAAAAALVASVAGVVAFAQSSSQTPTTTRPLSSSPVVTPAGPGGLKLTPVPVANDTLNFSSRLGSFKLLPSGPYQPIGRMEIIYTGSVLVTGLKGTLKPEGSIRREYFNEKHNKQGWYGTGKLTIDGEFRSILFFGKDMQGHYKGRGVMQMYGEFDKNLETGKFWFDPSEKIDWGTGGGPVGIPKAEETGPTPVPRRSGGG